MGARGRRRRGLRRPFPHLRGDPGHRSPHPGRRLRPGLPAAAGGPAAGTPAPRAEDRPPARPTVSEPPHSEGGEGGGEVEAGGAAEAHEAAEAGEAPSPAALEAAGVAPTSDLPAPAARGGGGRPPPRRRPPPV